MYMLKSWTMQQRDTPCDKVSYLCITHRQITQNSVHCPDT